MAGNCYCHDTSKKQRGKVVAECEVIALHLENVFNLHKVLNGSHSKEVAGVQCFEVEFFPSSTGHICQEICLLGKE